MLGNRLLSFRLPCGLLLPLVASVDELNSGSLILSAEKTPFSSESPSLGERESVYFQVPWHDFPQIYLVLSNSSWAPIVDPWGLSSALKPSLTSLTVHSVIQFLGSSPLGRGCVCVFLAQVDIHFKSPLSL